jgi:hypothetical protein
MARDTRASFPARRLNPALCAYVLIDGFEDQTQRIANASNARWRPRALGPPPRAPFATDPTHCETKARHFEPFAVRLAVDEDQVGADMTIAIVFPFASQRMIDIARWLRSIDGQKFEGLSKQQVEFLAKDAGIFHADSRL